MKLQKRKNILINRLGAKDNDIKFFNELLPENIKNVVEPFGGSFAICRRIYRDDKYIKYVNDNDPYLYECYRDPNKVKEIKKIYSEFFVNKKFTSTLYQDLENSFKNELEKKILKHVDKTLRIRGTMIKHISLKEVEDEEIDFIKKINFSNDNYKTIIDKFKDDKDTFIFLDPPYLFSDNSTYVTQENETDMTYILIDLLNYFKTAKCKIMLVINKLYILEWLFKDYIKKTYSKIYQLSKKKMDHLMICNY